MDLLAKLLPLRVATHARALDFFIPPEVGQDTVDGRSRNAAAGIDQVADAEGGRQPADTMDDELAAAAATS